MSQGRAPVRPPGRTAPVDLAGTLLVISGGLTLLGGLLLFSVASLGVLDSLLALARLGLAALEIVLGLHLHARRPGARVRALAVSAAAVVTGLLFLSRGGGTTLVGTLLPAGVAYLLLRADSRRELGADDGVLAADLRTARAAVATVLDALRVGRGSRRPSARSRPDAQDQRRGRRP